MCSHRNKYRHRNMYKVRKLQYFHNKVAINQPIFVIFLTYIYVSNISQVSVYNVYQKILIITCFEGVRFSLCKVQHKDLFV